MSTISKKFETKASKEELKTYINTKVLSRQELAPLINSAVWNGDVLTIDSKFGDGTVTLLEQEIEVTIHLSMFGSMAKSAIESSLDKGFKELPPKK